MNEFTRTIINGLKTYIQKSRGNWNQNDETAVDYIKNRTHWTEKKFVDIIPETTVSNPVVETEDFNLFALTSEHIKKVPNFTANAEYTVIWNGKEYKSVAKMVAEAGGIVCLGNVKKILGTGDTSEPFLIIPDTLNQLGAAGEDVLFQVASFDGSTSFTFKVSGLTTVIHKIDKKYLPEISSIKNILDGKAEGSVRTVGTNTNIGEWAFAEGYNTIASGWSSHAEGYNTIASDDYSHAEGDGTTASGWTSHAEGSYTEASGNYSHAECGYTMASGYASHAEGWNTEASGEYSHAEGYFTTASSQCQHVQGKYNIEDTENKYAHIVGNGATQGARSNAHTLDWQGNALFASDVYIGSTSGTNKDEGSKKLATEEYVDEKLSTAGSIPKLATYTFPITATKEGQTVFAIDLESFNPSTDTVMVQDGRTMLFPNVDFTVVGNTVVLTEGWNIGDTGGIYVFRIEMYYPL